MNLHNNNENIRTYDDNPISVLVAEDDNFQRLAILDILELCNYKANAVVNGKQAIEELETNYKNYDLALIDLFMPEMDGVGFLKEVQQNENLKGLPIIIMSASGEEDHIATCLKNGATDYIMKPVRISNIKALAAKIKHETFLHRISENHGWKYEVIKVLGRGAFGVVKQIRINQGPNANKIFAMKTIETELISQKEKQFVENEITLLKTVSGPTIISYHDHFITPNKIHILMEFAEGGGLNDQIEKYKALGKKFKPEQIFKWMIHIIIAIFSIHSKNILHRDIKAQNIFLTVDNICKLGDFGIAKALTSTLDFTSTYCGTPYYMAPEILNSEPYGHKTDIWSFGCTLYELLTLVQPFKADTMVDLTNKIVHDSPAPLLEDNVVKTVNNTEDVIKNNIKIVINSTLQKKPEKRPSIWELVKLDFIQTGIKQFFATLAPNSYIETFESLL